MLIGESFSKGSYFSSTFTLVKMIRLGYPIKSITFWNYVKECTLRVVMLTSFLNESVDATSQYPSYDEVIEKN